MRSCLLRSVGVSALCLFLSTTAGAEASDPAAAEALFRQGRAAADAGDFRTACSKFRESNRLDPAIGTVFNLADCEEKLGQVAAAWTHFQEVAQRLPPEDERRRIAIARASALEPRLPKLTIQLEGELPPGGVVKRGDVELTAASFGAPLPVDPGQVRVVVVAPGHEDAEFELQLAEGESQVLKVSVGRALGAEVGDEAPAASAPVLGYVLGGVGILGLGVGAVTGFMTLADKGAADDECPNQRCTQAGYDRVESGRTLGGVSTISLIVGSVFLATGAYLVLSHEEPAPGARGSRSRGLPRAALVPTAAPGGGGLGLFASF
ncbi:MAG: hypothetical protein KIT72_12775 [Polyangiaceae bacterium]|nr:hypothetical protein [Polyangiaceae bacterium]MCW5791287.1 hypothetical protein [Polyangiaceae bacterium]